MNKIFRFLIVAVCAACSIAFSACSDDDDDDNGGSSSAAIVGEWTLDAKKSSYTVNGVPSDKKGGVDLFDEFMNFKEDGSFVSGKGEDATNGKYSVSGKNLTLEATEDGMTFVVKKGTDTSDMMSMFDEEDMEDFGDMDFSKLMSSHIRNLTAEVVEGQLVLISEIEMNVNLSELDKLPADEDSAFFKEMIKAMFGNGKQTIVSKSVYNKK